MTEPRERRCKAVRADGSPCEAPYYFVDPSTGYCHAHGPGAAERLAEAGRKGAEASARLRLPEKRLVDDDLPPLTSHEAAETWTDRIGRAAATGRMTSSAANAALRAVREWREAHEGGKVSERLEALTEALAEWRRSGSPDAVLRLVDGGGKR